jgi:hypothetical protein
MTPSESRLAAIRARWAGVPEIDPLNTTGVKLTPEMASWADGQRRKRRDYRAALSEAGIDLPEARPYTNSLSIASRGRHGTWGTW